MMSDPTMVDRTTVDELTGKLVLVIDEPRPWQEVDLMHRQLAAKVKKYVRYIRSPEFPVQHGTDPKNTIIRLVSAEPPSEASLKFFERVAYELSKHGVIFEHQPGENGIPVTIDPSDVTQPPGKAARASPGAGTAAGTPSAPARRREPAPPPREPPAEPTAPEAESGEPDTPRPEPGVRASEPAAQSSELETQAHEPGTRPEEPQPAPTTDPPELEAATPPPIEFDAQEIIDRAQKRKKDAPSPPPFFPEEEFGRSLPDLDHVETALSPEPSAEPAVIESPSGDEYVLAVEMPEDPRRRSRGKRKQARDGQPSVGRAALAALWAAVAGAVIWGLLAIPAANGASLLAIAVAIMVGFNVRLRGNGNTLAFRLIGAIGTLLGSAMGGVLAAATLTAAGVGLPYEPEPGQSVGVNAALHVLSNPDATIAAITRYFGLLDIVAIVVAVYVAFRLSVAKPSS